MTPELFLELLTRHNTLIIQVLVTIVLVISAFVIYRIYVAGDAAEGEAGAGTQHLEKTLQKFLEMQSASGAKTESSAATTAGGGGDVEKLREEILQHRAAIKEKDEKIAALESQAGNAAGGISAEEKAKYEAKIHDLEQRLAEYEIIAEDIADLARYREENIKLKEELQKLKDGGGATAVAVPAAEPATEAPAAPPESAPQPTAEVAAAPTEEVVAASAEPAAPVAEPTPAAENTAVAAATTETPAVTDELMAEFEAAVVQQKETSAEPQAVPGQEIPEEERKRMLDDFESFVKKS